MRGDSKYKFPEVETNLAWTKVSKEARWLPLQEPGGDKFREPSCQAVEGPGHLTMDFRFSSKLEGKFRATVAWHGTGMCKHQFLW